MNIVKWKMEIAQQPTRPAETDIMVIVKGDCVSRYTFDVCAKLQFPKGVYKLRLEGTLVSR